MLMHEKTCDPYILVLRSMNLLSFEKSHLKQGLHRLEKYFYIEAQGVNSVTVRGDSL